MAGRLDDVLQTLRDHEDELRRLGASHAAVFGSVARGEAKPSSDILDWAGDVVHRKTLKPLLRDSILHDAINAF